jgi:hypothetical protein
MTREQLIEIARLCARQSYLASTKDVAAILWRMALEYWEKAAKLDSGELVGASNSSQMSPSAGA